MPTFFQGLLYWTVQHKNYRPASLVRGFPGGIVGKESACQCKRCKRHGFHLWVRKILWHRKWQPISIFLVSGSTRIIDQVAQMVKSLPAMQETQVQSQDQEDPLEKEMTTHSSNFAWRISRTEKPGGLQSMGLSRVIYN